MTEDGWPYVQHCGGPLEFLRVLGPKTLAFADYDRDQQFHSGGELCDERSRSLFLRSYPERGRLKLVGHARVVDGGTDPALEARVSLPGDRAKAERVVVIEVNVV